LLRFVFELKQTASEEAVCVFYRFKITYPKNKNPMIQILIIWGIASATSMVIAGAIALASPPKIDKK